MAAGTSQVHQNALLALPTATPWPSLLETVRDRG
jgi:hypothetical protein